MKTKFKSGLVNPNWQTIEEKEKNFLVVMRRSKALIRWLVNNWDEFPITYSVDEIGHDCIRLFIGIGNNEKNTVRLVKWLSKQKKWEVEKFWREEHGYFSYHIIKKYGYFMSYHIFFEESANIDGCVIKKKRVTKYIFKTDCEKETVKMN